MRVMCFGIVFDTQETFKNATLLKSTVASLGQ